MANDNAPRGLRPVKQQSPGPTVQNGYKIKSAYASDIYQGDPVSVTTDGTIILGTNAGTAHVGVFNGVNFVDAEGKQQFKSYWPSGTVATEIEALVFDDPTTQFVVQATTADQTDVGVAYDLTIATGDPKTGVSKTVLNKAGTTGAAYRIDEISRVVGNETGAYCDVVVTAVKHARS